MKWQYCKITKFSDELIEAIQNSPELQTEIAQLGADMSKKEQVLVKILTGSGEKNQNRFVEDVDKELAGLGLDGWELISHTQTLSFANNLFPAKENYYLKRPIQE